MGLSEEAVGSGPDYLYGSLAEDHFRVIEINSLDPIISLQLVDYADDSPPKYFALSYAWGAQPNTEQIICNGKVLNVSPHLHEGLRSIGAASPGTRLWIDAICINQTSNAEKATQVAKMHHIYRKAQGVYVWLGKEEYDSDRVMDAINDLEIPAQPELSDVEMLLPSIAKDDALFSGFVGIRALEKIKVSQSDSTKRLSFFDFVVLGREKSAKEPVDHIYALLGMAGEADGVYRKEIGIDYSEEARAQFWKLYTIFGKIALRNERHLRLLSIVSSGERHEELPSWCPDLRFIMATSNLYEDGSYRAGWTWDDHSTSSRLQDCSTHTNFKGAEHSHVSVSLDSDTIQIWGASLGPVRAIGPPKQWDLDMYTDDISKANPFAKAVLRWLADCEDFCTRHWKSGATALHIWNEVLVGAGNSKRRPKRDSGEKIILRRPKKIENSGDVENTTDKRPANQSMGGTEGAADAKDYVDDDPDFEDQVIDPADSGGEDKAYTFLHSTLTEIVNLDLNIDWREQNPRLLRDLQACYVWLLFIEQTWNKRVLFATSNGDIGFSSQEMMAGDIAVVLYGGQTLYVLREHGSEYRFIGDAYAYGCVDGEIFDMLDEGKAKEVLFSIR